MAVNGCWKLCSSAPYRFSGGVVLILAENRPCAAKSTCRHVTLVLTESFPSCPRSNSSKAEPVEGQTRRRNLGRHYPKRVRRRRRRGCTHRKQIRPSSESGGSALLQCSQVSLSSSMTF